MEARLKLPRSTKEWVGTTDDTPIPPRVKLRVKARANDTCSVCGARVRYGAQIDHTKALINGGENRESNLRLLCKTCHAPKTRSDVAEKSRAHKKQISLAGFKRKSRWQWRTFNGEIRCNWDRDK